MTRGTCLTHCHDYQTVDPVLPPAISQDHPYVFAAIIVKKGGNFVQDQGNLFRFSMSTFSHPRFIIVYILMTEYIISDDLQSSLLKIL